MPVKKESRIKNQELRIKAKAKAPVKALVKMQVKTAVKPAAKKKLSPLSLEIFDAKGKVKETIELPKVMFGAKVNKALLSQAVRVYLANQRLGTASTKTRAEVIGSTKKIWQQKGTGRARHGSRKAPLFVGGGVAFGPRPRDFSLNLPKSMKRLALFSALASKLQNREIKGVAGLDKLEPKTKLAAEVFKNLGILEKKKKVLVVLPKGAEFGNLQRSVRNIRGVSILNANMLNAYQVLDNRVILLLKEAIPDMENTFLRKGENEEK